MFNKQTKWILDMFSHYKNIKKNYQDTGVSGMVDHTVNPRTWEARANRSEFKSILVYLVSSVPTGAT